MSLLTRSFPPFHITVVLMRKSVLADTTSFLSSHSHIIQENRLSLRSHKMPITTQPVMGAHAHLTPSVPMVLAQSL